MGLRLVSLVSPMLGIRRFDLEHEWVNRFAGYVTGLFCVVVLTVAIGLAGLHQQFASISMVYLIAVLIAAAGWGAGPAILTSVASFLVFDWFFVGPYHILAVANPDEWLSLLLFLLTALITGQLAAALRAEVAKAQRRQHEAATLYDFSLALSLETDLKSLIVAAAEGFVRIFGAQSCGILLAEAAGHTGEWIQVGPAVDFGKEEQDLVRSVLDQGSSGFLATATGKRVIRIVRPSKGCLKWAKQEHRVLYYPIRKTENVVGVLRLVGVPEATGGRSQITDQLLFAFCEHVAVAIDRARLQIESERAHVIAESDRLKTALLSSVSHDLRTPLTAIKAEATSLLQEAVWQDTSASQDLIAGIIREADRLNRLVGNVLDMSRIEAGVLRPRKEWHSMAEIVFGVVDGLGQMGTGRCLSVTISDDLPLVPVDYVQIQQVVTNLVENAIKYSFPDSQVTINVWVEESNMLVSVADRGMGIASTEIEQVFEKFFRGSKASNNAITGVGLGLAISKGIITAHGGEIWARNDEEGVIFTFSIPLSDPDLPAPAELAPESLAKSEVEL